MTAKKTQTVYRCSKTGRFITAAEAKRRPATAERQRLKVSRWRKRRRG